MFSIKLKLFLFALIALTLPLIYIGWERWLATTPQPLPNISAVGNANNNGLPQGSYYEVSIPFATSTDRKLSAEYRLWIPDRVATLRGLIVKQHGCGDPAAATGLDHANDLQWQALAIKHQFALLGTKLPNGNPLCTDEVIANRSADKSFLVALHALTEKSHHPELENLPWALWGHSGGADWGMQMLRNYPDRVIAVVNVRCGGIASASGKSEILDLDPKSASTLYEVPVLWTIGEKDPFLAECTILPKAIFSKYRKAGAKWAIAIAPNAGHEAGDTRLLAIPYFDAIITERLKPNEAKLRSIDDDQNWLGNPVTHDVTPNNQYKDQPLDAAWLPNEETARKWKNYTTSGKITVSQKPPSPTGVSTKKIGDADALLRWKYTPDLENGLPSFRIYRNNILIQTLKGQSWNFGDAPYFPNVVLEFRDKNATLNSKYAIAAFNILGESVSQSVQSSS